MESILKGKRDRYCEKKDFTPAPVLKCKKDLYNDIPLQFLDPQVAEHVSHLQQVTDFNYKKFLEKHLMFIAEPMFEE
jgi:hypothetical protein